MADKPDALALARRETLEIVSADSGMIRNVLALQDRIDKLQTVANVMAPSVVGALPPKQALAMGIVLINPEPATFDGPGGGEVYKDPRFCKGDHVALGKVAILKLLGAAGIATKSSRRMDDGKDPHYCLWQIVLVGRDMTGQLVEQPGSSEQDFRDGSGAVMKPEKEGDRKTGRLVPMDASAIADLRRRIVPLAETKALLRAARAFPTMPLKQTYSRVDVAKPWVTMRLVPALDMSDPEDAKLAREMAMGVALFGRSEETKRLPEPAADVDEVLVPEIVGGSAGAAAKSVGETPAARAVGSTPAPSTKPDPDEPGDADEDFDVGGLAHEEPNALILCLCPCGDQTEITAKVAERTIEHLGSPRCVRCFPALSFDFKAHADIRDFKMPKHPKLTIDDIRKNVDRLKAKK